MTNGTKRTRTRAKRVERELDSTRERLEGTLDAIEERLTTGHLLDEVWRWVGEHGDDVGGATAWLARIVARNPLPVALAGSGLAWLAAHEAARAGEATEEPGGGGRGTTSQREHREGGVVGAAHHAVDLVAAGVRRAGGLARRAVEPVVEAGLPQLVGAGALGAMAFVTGAAVGLFGPR